MSQHEIQATTVEKAVRFEGPFRLSNIRIHGTMCRKVHSCENNCPLRYLVIDPRERDTMAEAQRLDRNTVRQVTAVMLRSDPYMKAAQGLAQQKRTMQF